MDIALKHFMNFNLGTWKVPRPHPPRFCAVLTCAATVSEFICALVLFIWKTMFLWSHPTSLALIIFHPCLPYTSLILEENDLMKSSYWSLNYGSLCSFPPTATSEILSIASILFYKFIRHKSLNILNLILKLKVCWYINTFL